MPISALSHFLVVLGPFTYALLFPLAIAEGPLVTIVAGYLASRGYVDPFLVFAVVVSADLTGDLVLYGAGRWSRRGANVRWGRYLGITRENLELVEHHFRRHGGKTLLAGKAAQLVGALILFAAGAARMRPRRFLAFNVLATVPKSLILVLFGYFFGRAIGRAASALDYATVAFGGAVVLVLTLYVLPRHVLRRFRVLPTEESLQPK